MSLRMLARRALLGAALICGAAAAEDPPSAQTFEGRWWDAVAQERIELKADGSARVAKFRSTLESSGKWTRNESGGVSLETRGLAGRGGEKLERRELRHQDGHVVTGDGDSLRRLIRVDRSEIGSGIAADARGILEANATLARADCPGGVDRIKLREKSQELKTRIERAEFLLVEAGDRTRWAGEALRAEAAGEQARLRAVCLDRLCRERLQKLGVYLEIYMTKHKEYPARLADLKSPDIMPDAADIVCPVAEAERQYKYVVPGAGEKTAPSAIVVSCDSAHTDGCHNVIQYSGKVVRIPEARFAGATAAGKAEGACLSAGDLKVRWVAVEGGAELQVSLVATGTQRATVGTSGIFRAGVTLCLRGAAGEVLTSVKEIETEAHGAGVHGTFRWVVPKEALSQGAYLTVEVRDDFGGGSDSVTYRFH